MIRSGIFLAIAISASIRQPRRANTFRVAMTSADLRALHDLCDQVDLRIRANGLASPLRYAAISSVIKPAAAGTGLSPSRGYGIAKKHHGGKVDISSRPGIFTEFVLTLPRQAPAANRQTG